MVVSPRSNAFLKQAVMPLWNAAMSAAVICAQVCPLCGLAQ